jgi:hypothetical protein
LSAKADKIAVRVICGRVDVLRGSIFPTYAELELLKSPVGYGSGTDLLKLFEAIARFLGSKKITLLTDESKLDESFSSETELMTSSLTRRSDRLSL